MKLPVLPLDAIISVTMCESISGKYFTVLQSGWGSVDPDVLNQRLSAFNINLLNLSSTEGYLISTQIGIVRNEGAKMFT